MALFAKLPPGEQIKRWLFILTIMVIIVDLIAAASLMVVTNLMGSVVNRYQPLMMSSGDITAGTYRVHTGLYQYLAEYRKDTEELQEEVKRLRDTIRQTFMLSGAVGLEADLKEMDVILEKYQKIIKLLPQIGTVTNWNELEELKNQAVALGGQIEELAGRMKADSYKKMMDKAARSNRIADVAMYVFIGFFALSLIIIVLLFVWWRSFQEMILAL